MKKIIACFAGLALACGAFAKGSSSSYDGAGQGPYSIVSVEYAQRVLYFDSTRNAITPQGQILVCPVTFKVDRDSKCLDAQDRNAWTDLMTMDIPGYKIVGYEYRLSGSSAYRGLFVYYRAK